MMVFTLSEVVLELVEKLEQFVADPFAISPATHPCRDEHFGVFEAVQRASGGRRRHLIALRRGLGAHDWLGWQTHDDLASHRICSWRACSSRELLDEGIEL